MRRMLTTILSRPAAGILLLISLASLNAWAEPDCDNQSTCADAVIDAKTGLVSVQNTCEKAIRCEICPTFGSEVALNGCRSVDLAPDAEPVQIDFKRRPTRLNRVCLLQESFDVCRAPRTKDPRDARKRVQASNSLTAMEEIQLQRATDAMDAMTITKYAPSKPTSTPENAWGGRTSFTLELLGVSSYSTLNSLTPNVSAFSIGASIRPSLLVLGSPSGGTWLGFRVGAGLEPSMQFVSTIGQETGEGSGSSFALRSPLFLGFQVMPGTFASSELWKGITLGLDYMPYVVYTGGGDFAPLGFNAHIAYSTLRPATSTEGISPHFDVNVFFAPATGSRPWTIAFGLGVIWM